MISAWSNPGARPAWLEDRTRPVGVDALRVGVAGIAAEVVLWTGESIATSFYLRLGSAQGTSRETLGERLNDLESSFLPCKIGEAVELLGLDWISFLRVEATLPEVGRLEEIGATRQRARVSVQCGYTLEGEFIYVQPITRARLSDFLNVCGDRFLLFLAPAAVFYLNRKAITRVVP